MLESTKLRKIHESENEILQELNNNEGGHNFDIIPGMDVLLILSLTAFFRWSGIFSFGSLDVDLNPFWIPVVLSAVLYGIGPGLVTVGMAAGIEWAIGRSPPGVDADYYSYLLTNLGQPTLWLLTVGVLGHIRQRQLDTASAHQDEAKERRIQADVLAERCQALRKEIAQLEHLMAISGATNAELAFALLQELATATPHRLGETYRQTLARLLGADGVEIVPIHHTGPDPRLGIGRSWGRRNAAPRERDPRAPLLRALLAERRTLICTREPDLRWLASHAAMAVLIPGQGGRAIGAVLIGQVHPDCLSPAGEAALSVTTFILGQRLAEGDVALTEVGTATARSPLRILPGNDGSSAAEN